jgi:urea transport system ATP-binding protein
MLDARDLHLHYGASHTLRGVTFALEPGKVTCLLGRNGVGKTTTLRALVGQARLTSGAIRLDGVDVTAAPAHRRARAGIAIVPQGREIFPRLTVAENLSTGFAARRDRARRIDDAIFGMFPVLKDMLQRRGGDLSGGQQQQLAIGRALMADPKVLLLDEPTEGIQPNIVTLIGQVVRQLAAGGRMAILLVEQYLDFALEVGDRFLVMDRGRIVLEGDRATLDRKAAERLIAV